MNVLQYTFNFYICGHPDICNNNTVSRNRVYLRKNEVPRPRLAMCMVRGVNMPYCYKMLARRLSYTCTVGKEINLLTTPTEKHPNNSVTERKKKIEKK